MSYKTILIYIYIYIYDLFCFVSSPELKAQMSYSDHYPSVVHPSVCPLLFSLNDFSKTTELISTKVGRKHLREFGLNFV